MYKILRRLNYLFFITTFIMSNQSLIIASEDTKYNWNEHQAKSFINSEIETRFGKEISSWWPFLSDEEKVKRKMQNQEIESIKLLASGEIESPDNYKRVLIQEPFTRYVTKIVSKPFQRVITEWKNVEESIPVTDFRPIKEKRWSPRRLRERIGSAIIKFFESKSYDYALKKTNNPVIADIIKKEIVAELIQGLHVANLSLPDFIGKNREDKINAKINKLLQKEEISLKDLEAKPIIPTAPNFTVYPSDKCCICYVKLASSNRILLDPCGHDLCSSCFKKYDKKCAICRADVISGIPENHIFTTPSSSVK